jgi:hypothetical protein
MRAAVRSATWFEWLVVQWTALTIVAGVALVGIWLAAPEPAVSPRWVTRPATQAEERVWEAKQLSDLLEAQAGVPLEGVR